MIKIISALYADKDVTEIVSSRIIDNTLSFMVSNNLFGDPLPGMVKWLTVKYEEDGKLKEESFKEESMCYVPIVPKPITLYNGKVRKVKFITPFPDVPYYLWQALVQINNFRRLGYEVETHYPVCYFNNRPSDTLMRFVNSDNIKAKFHIYHDNRPDVSYTASIKPWLMSQYFKEFPEEIDSVYIYLDPDVIFLKPINWNPFTGDNIWYESNTCSYLDTSYIKSKGEGLLEEMCADMGISPELVIKNDLNCGGAQYITKNNTFEYWSKVEKTSTSLYKVMRDTADKYFKPEMVYPIQAWTSEMWTTNWVLWMMGVETKCIPELDFHWANHQMAGLGHSIYHNAGVTLNDGIHFSKIAYQTSPFNKETKGSETSLSYKYIEEIKDTEKNFPELLF